MTNIFNLFLFLLTCWVLLMLSASHFSWFYLFIGIVSSALISLFASYLKLINKKSELLYLSLGFYRHFFKIFFENFFTSMKLIINSALGRNSFNPIVYKVHFREKNKFNPALLMMSFNMTTGLFCIDASDNEIFVHALSENYFKKFDMRKTCTSLNGVNDDNLV